MRTFDRYLASLFLKNLFIAVLGVTFIFVGQMVLTQILEREYTITQILTYHGLGLPEAVIRMLPPSVLLATALSLSGINATHELVAAYSIGISLQRIMSVIGSLVLIVACASLVVQDRIVPAFFKRQTVFYWREMKGRPDFHLDIRQNRVWYRSQNMIYNLQSFDESNQTVRGIAVYAFDDDFNLRQLIRAEKAVFTPNEGWLLKQGSVTLFPDEESFPLTQKFEEKKWMVSEKPSDFQEIEKEIDGLRLREFYQYIARTRESGTDTKRYEARFHSKISLPFTTLVMCFLAVPFSVRMRRQGGLARDLNLCLAVSFFYWLFYSIGLSLGANGALPPWLAAWLPSMIFAALAVTLIARQKA
jgi:lipopolysaccharide export system permease protein